MKIFFEVQIPVEISGRNADSIIARLTSIGFDGFVEEEDHILAYREKTTETTTELAGILRREGFEVKQIREIVDKNWNAIWESEYESVIISDKLMVRAPFHSPKPGIAYDIVIEPKMSFGTAHHETTSMMLDLILDLEIEGKSVLDMGSGTAVLAILARKKGASRVVAIDNDEWAFNNAIDNVEMNEAGDIKVELGDASAIGTRRFDIIFANINRNILLEDIPAYAQALEKGGALLLSGFYGQDLPLIAAKCQSSGLTPGISREKNRWTAAVFTKD